MMGSCDILPCPSQSWRDVASSSSPALLLPMHPKAPSLLLFCGPASVLPLIFSMQPGKQLIDL